MIILKNEIVKVSDRINITDKNQIDEFSRKNRIFIKDHATGKDIFGSDPLHNKVVLAGSTYNAQRICPVIKPKIWTPTYNTDLVLDNSVNEPYTGEGGRPGEYVFLIAVGKNGSGPDLSQKKLVKYASRIEPEDLVPFKYVPVANDITVAQRAKYFGRKKGDARIAYNFKTWEGTPEYKQQFLDGTPIDENIYSSERAKKEEVESFIQYYFKITTDDCRDWFRYTTSMADARISQISLLTAWKKTIDGFDYFQDIRPYTVLNLTTELLIDEDKAFDIIYQVLP